MAFWTEHLEVSGCSLDHVEEEEDRPSDKRAW